MLANNIKSECSEMYMYVEKKDVAMTKGGSAKSVCVCGGGGGTCPRCPSLWYLPNLLLLVLLLLCCTTCSSALCFFLS